MELTEEHKENISISLKRAYIENRRTGFSKGQVPWNKDLKGIQPYMNLEGLKLGRYKGKKLSIETRERMSESHKKKLGPLSSNWKGGTSRGYKTGYWSLEYRLWRKAVFARDNYTCQDCGLHGSEGYLTAHHIKSFAEYPKLRFLLENGLTLCEECHKLTDNYKGRGRRVSQFHSKLDQ